MTIEQFFDQNNKVSLAFSGGVDSAYLLYTAVKCGADVKAYYVKTQFQPEFEFQDALRLGKELGIEISVINIDVLQSEDVVNNPSNRCYYCKNILFSEILKRAKADGYEIIIDGTNASDDVNDRPGMRALKELSVRSPLRECGLTKDEIRRRSKEAGLFTHDKPAYACLSTRIRCGEKITEEKLKVTEMSEKYLSKLGFIDFRVRMEGKSARVQIRKDQGAMMMELSGDVRKELLMYYDEVVIEATR